MKVARDRQNVAVEKMYNTLTNASVNVYWTSSTYIYFMIVGNPYYT